jgi:hypothetical protein
VKVRLWIRSATSCQTTAALHWVVVTVPGFPLGIVVLTTAFWAVTFHLVTCEA